MATNRRSARAARYAIALLVAGGCAPTMRSDLSAVRELSKVRAPLPSLREDRVAEDTDTDARKVLERPLDADAAVRVALLNNRELRARLRELGVARARVLQAGLVANPELEVELPAEHDADLELKVEYEVSSLIIAPLKRAAEQRELEAERLAVAAHVVQLGYDVRAAFYALATAERRLAFARESLEALAAARDAALAVFEAGNAPQLSAATHVAGYERARVTVARIELEAASLREALHRWLGLHGDDTRWTLAASLATIPAQLPALEDLERKAIEANLDLQATHKRLAALAERTRAAQTEGWLPELTMNAYSVRGASESGERAWSWGGGVGIEVPLFNHGQGERRGYEAQHDALLERYYGLATELRSAARDASNRLRSAHGRARHYETVILPAQEAVMEQTLLQYNAMQIGVFPLLEAHRALLDARLAYADTVREYWTAHAAYEALCAGRAVEPREVAASTQLQTSADSEGGH